MSGRIIRIELRRSSAVLLAVTFAVLTLAMLVFHGPWNNSTGAWNLQWQGLAQWQRYVLTFSWPFVVGVGAWQGSRQRRSGMDELLASTSLPAWRRVGVLIATMTIALTVAYLVPFVVGAVQVAGATSYFGLGWLPTMLVGILAVVAGAVLGMGIGHLLPYVVTPPVVTVLGFALMFTVIKQTPDGLGAASTAQIKVGLLSPVLQGALTGYTTVAAGVHIGQILSYLGIAGTGFALLTVRGAARRVGAAVPAVLGVVLAALVLPGQVAAAYPLSAAAASPVCDRQGPQVCVTALHQSLLGAYTGPARQALAALAVLPNAPTSAQEVPNLPPGQLAPLSRPANVLQISATQAYYLYQHDPDQVRDDLLAGAGTLECIGVVTPQSDDQAGQQTDQDSSYSRLITTDWLLGEQTMSAADIQWYLPSETDADRQAIDSAWATLHALPRAEQIQRIAAVRDAGLTCHGDPFDILVHGTGA